MRKSSRILACVLAAILLLSSVVISASALGYDSSENQQLTLSGLNNDKIISNYTGSYPSVNDFETQMKKVYGSAPSAGTYSHVSQTDASGTVVNKYLRFSHDANSSTKVAAGSATSNYNTDWYGGARTYNNSFGFWQ